MTMTIQYAKPDPTRVLGMDCAHGDGAIDFAKARQNGIQFVFVKAKNSIYTTNWFIENWQAAKEAGIARGAYMWLYPAGIMSTNRQATELHKLLSGESGELPGADFGELPAVVDFEWTKYNGKAANPDTGDLYGFVKTWEDLTGKKPIIYTSAGYWNQYGSQDAFWADYLLWVANYGVKAPSVPKPWSEYTFWQWSERGCGLDYGVSPLSARAIDLDYFVGDALDFEIYFGKAIEAPELPGEEEGEEQMSGYKVMITWPKGASIRPGPNVRNTAIGTPLPQGSVFNAVEIIPDSDEPGNEKKRWADRGDGTYVAVLYPSSSAEYIRAIWSAIGAETPVGGAPIRTRVELDNGEIWEAQDFRKIS